MPCPADLPETAVKVLSSTGGFLGGSSMMLYMRPVNLADAARRCVVSVIAAAMLTVPIASKMFDQSGSEILMGVGFGIGFIAWSLLGAIAKFFDARQGQDVVQMMKDVNEVRTPSVQPYYPPIVQTRRIDNPDE